MDVMVRKLCVHCGGHPIEQPADSGVAVTSLGCLRKAPRFGHLLLKPTQVTGRQSGQRVWLFDALVPPGVWPLLPSH